MGDWLEDWYPYDFEELNDDRDTEHPDWSGDLSTRILDHPFITIHRVAEPRAPRNFRGPRKDD